jgi:hypothetical protein
MPIAGSIQRARVPAERDQLSRAERKPAVHPHGAAETVSQEREDPGRLAGIGEDLGVLEEIVVLVGEGYGRSSD